MLSEGFFDLQLEALVGFRVAEVAFDVIDAFVEPAPHCRVDMGRRVLWNFVSEQFAKTVGVVIVRSESDDGELFREEIFLREIAERGEEFAFGEVSGGHEDDHDAGCGDWISVGVIQAHSIVSRLSMLKSIRNDSIKCVAFDSA